MSLNLDPALFARWLNAYATCDITWFQPRKTLWRLLKAISTVPYSGEGVRLDTQTFFTIRSTLLTRDPSQEARYALDVIVAGFIEDGLAKPVLPSGGPATSLPVQVSPHTITFSAPASVLGILPEAPRTQENPLRTREGRGRGQPSPSATSTTTSTTSAPEELPFPSGL